MLLPVFLLIAALDEMNPRHWHLQSHIINRDHAYCRPSHLDPISTLCIEPASKPVVTTIDQSWLDIEEREVNITLEAGPDSSGSVCSSHPPEELTFNHSEISYAYVSL